MPLFLENALEKTTEYFLKFLFLFESTILLFNFCEQHDPITIGIDCNGLSQLIFEKKMAQLCLWTKIRTKQ